MAGFRNDVVYATNADFSIAGGGGGLAANGIQTDGQMWVGSTALNAGGTHINVAKLTSPLGTLTIGYSSPNITLDITGGTAAIEKISVQTGTSPVIPSGGIITLNGATVAAGTNPVRTDGTNANTIAIEIQKSQAIAAADTTKIGLANFNSTFFTVDATGFVGFPSLTGILTGNGASAITASTVTQHGVLVGGASNAVSSTAVGSTGQVLQANTGADPTYSTATYPSTTTINQILYSSAANVVSGLATANNGVLTTGTGGVPVITALASNGQLIIGSGSGAPAAATLTAGTGITITNAANSITIASSQLLNYTLVDDDATPYTVLAADDYISCDVADAALTLKFPNAPATGKTWIVKDLQGSASTNNISITTVGGTVTIDGQTTYKIASNYGSVQLLFNGTNYEVY